MESLITTVERAVLSWPGTTAEPHRFGGVEFRANGHELGHLHGARQADLPFPVRVREELVAAGRAQPHHLLPQTGWVTYYIAGPEDADNLIALFRLNYDRITANARTGQGRADSPATAADQ